MIRRFLCACMGAVLVGTWALSDHAVAKPPDLPEDGTVNAAPQTSPPAPTIEVLPMPREETDITCPYLRGQALDRHACQIADPDMGREVLDNLKRLKEADNLLELAKDLARDGLLVEAMECCDRAADLCPGSPCAERAVQTMIELALGLVTPLSVADKSEELESKKSVITPEEKAEWERIWFVEMPSRLTPEWPRNGVFPYDEEPRVEPLVAGLMDSCYLLMRQGMQHEAARLARQAYALDPERVLADPLVYKMHLLAQPEGSSEESEPPTCPYSPTNGKPIREIVPRKKSSVAEETAPSAVDYVLMIGVNDKHGLRVGANCSLGSNVYHLSYKDGSLKIWTTPDAGKTKP